MCLQAQGQTCYDNINQEFVATYLQCADNPGATGTAPLEVFLGDLVCDPTCGPLYNSTFFSLCSSPSLVVRLLVEYYFVQCRVNANGRACYTFYNDSDIDMSVANNEALQLCNPSAQSNTCSDQCKARLMAIRNYYGVCVNSLFNSSYFQSFSYELVPLFSYRLWTNCEVPVPSSTGQGTEQPTSSAITCLKIAIILAVFCAILAVLLVY